MVSLIGREERRVGGQREVDTGETTRGFISEEQYARNELLFWKEGQYVRHQVGLEFVQVDVQATIETEGRSDAGNDLGDQPVQVGEAGGGNTELLLADLEDGFIVDHERAVRVLEGGVGSQDRVVRLDNRARQLGSGVDGKFEFGFFAVVSGEPLHEQSTEAGTSATTKRVEDEEALEARAVIRKTADSVAGLVNELLPNSVVTASVVVGGILLASKEGLGVEEGAVLARLHLVDDWKFR